MAGALTNFQRLSAEDAAPWGPALARGLEGAYQLPTLQQQLAQLQAHTRTAQAQAQYAPQMAQAELKLKQAQAENPILSSNLGQLLYLQSLANGGKFPGLNGPPGTPNPAPEGTQAPPSQVPTQSLLPPVSVKTLGEKLAKIPGVKVQTGGDGTLGSYEPTQTNLPAPPPAQQQKIEQFATAPGTFAPGPPQMTAPNVPQQGTNNLANFEQYQSGSIAERALNEIFTGNAQTPAQRKALDVEEARVKAMQGINIDAYAKEVERASGASELAVEQRNLVGEWKDLYDKTPRLTGLMSGQISVAPGSKSVLTAALEKAGYLTNEDIDRAQSMDQFRNGLVSILARQKATGAITNDQYDLAASQKPDRSWEKGAVDRYIGYSESITDQTQEYAQFVKAAVKTGASIQDAKLWWADYITRNPTYDRANKIPDLYNIYGWRQSFGLEIPKDAQKKIEQQRIDRIKILESKPLDQLNAEEVDILLREAK